MPDTETADTVKALLARYGRSYSAELGLDLSRNTPSVLFRWLCASLLLSARISADLAMRGAKALAENGWTTAEKMAQSTWEERTRCLNQSGYARYDERTSSMLGDVAQMLLERYDGDLRKLREEAGRDPAREHELLTRFKGIGDVGADIFLREAQIAWRENYPLADKKACNGARKLGLPDTAAELSTLVPDEGFADLVAALVRADLDGADADSLRRSAAD
ncbi:MULTISPECIES: hypothetical protein [unclassified Roseitalea]|uniref:hypothetical protein n=1 Tax=unclassified Roseitalea TaxID=2639107 RepID=UPI00273E9374|nr:MULTISPECIES: hypothetical protein [unclassified Roseitalea]